MIHTGNIQDRIQEAKDTFFMAEEYMDCLGIEFEQLRRQKMTDEQVKEYIELLLPMEKEPTDIQGKNIIRLRKDKEYQKSLLEKQQGEYDEYEDDYLIITGERFARLFKDEMAELLQEYIVSSSIVKRLQENTMKTLKEMQIIYKKNRSDSDLGRSAAEYFRIGQGRLRQIVADNPNADYIL